MVLEKSQKKCSMNLIRTLNQYEVPYPENFWSRFTRFGVQKMNPKKRSVLYAKVYFLIKYGVIEEKHGYFIKKKYATTP